MTKLLLTLLALLLVYYSLVLGKDLLKYRPYRKKKIIIAFLIGLVTDFFDTLGIGSFAPTTLSLRGTHFLDTDKELPGTLNVSHAIPTVIEAFLFITVIKVAPLTLFTLVLSAMAGSWVGAHHVIKMSEKRVQIVMAIALLTTAALMTIKHLGWIDLLGRQNQSNALLGGALVVGGVGTFILGLLMTFGVGFYAPCMALVYFLGLDPFVAFPIMMASCAGILPIASLKFIKAGSYSREAVLGIMFGGVIGVFAALGFVETLDLNLIVWVIISVIVYTAVSMLLKNLSRNV